jgi:glycogen debranching enzyme
MRKHCLKNKEALGLIHHNIGGEIKMAAVYMSMKTLPWAILLSLALFFWWFWGSNSGPYTC